MLNSAENKTCSAYIQKINANNLYFFSCKAELNMKFFVLINIKMPTIVGILIFISTKNSCSTELSMKMFYNLRPRFHELSRAQDFVNGWKDSPLFRLIPLLNFNQTCSKPLHLRLLSMYLKRNKSKVGQKKPPRFQCFCVRTDACVYGKTLGDNYKA